MTGFIHRSFAGGEVSQALIARADTTKYETGLSLCKNAYVTRFGGVRNRAGFGYVSETGAASDNVRVAPFKFSATEAYAIEIGPLYMRVHLNGALLTTGAVAAWDASSPTLADQSEYKVGDFVKGTGATANIVYYCAATHYDNSVDWGPGEASTNPEFWYQQPVSLGDDTPIVIPTIFAAADIEDLYYEQAGDEMTITHPDYPPHQLVRHSATRWTCQPIAFRPAPTAPSNAAGLPSGSAVYEFTYVVTAVDADTEEESVAWHSNTDNFTADSANAINHAAAITSNDDLIVKHSSTTHGWETGARVKVVEITAASVKSLEHVKLALQDTVWSIKNIDTTSLWLGLARAVP